ncbi:hypothetical protein OE88DRAFT_1736676 [Heliocybe sulcata]|uniref:Uncharacterized protein n=1 Tax=Heliocybe sulcata TaxID=5364 RepID=A0A5C3N7B5_9AGAM|nr:hypothetical protein OE88DRAFT_1736676 [Heliocybe sulcata]
MATPSSSATTPSPSLDHLQASPAPSTTTTGSTADAPDSQERDAAVNKFIARARVSKLTFELRSRLAYASYKASHQVPHLPLHDLEVKTQVASISRSIPAKRKVTTSSSLHPLTQSPGLLSRQGQMAPPPPVPRTPSSGPSGPAKTGQSLFAALLGPPASKNARTIRNPSAPPAPVPARIQQGRKPTQHASPRTRPKSHPDLKKSRHHRGRSRERHHTHKGKGKEKGKEMEMAHERGTPDSTSTIVDDPDLAAAAQTLSSFLLPRNSFSTASARSSFSAASDHSHSQFAQSSARTAEASSSSTTSAGRPLTPPESQETATPADTPKKRLAPTDKEAAEYMLILATSPSPARIRHVDRDARDRAAFNVLGGGGSRSLFGGSGSSGTLSASPSRTARKAKSLTRDDGSFSSTIPVITPADTQSTEGSSQNEEAASSGTAFTPATLLRPPPSPLPTRPSSSLSIFPTQGELQPPTPGNFNLREFVNMSPSPGTPRKPVQTKIVPSSPRPAKKLFEQESRDSGGHDASAGGPLAEGFVDS